MKRVTFLVALAVAAGVVASAWPGVRGASADSAPLYPAGGSLTTAGETQVRMAAEKVSVDIEHDGNAGYRARVVADFRLYNPGPAVSLTVGYPEGVRTPDAEAEGPFTMLTPDGSPITVEGLTVEVDEQPVTVSEQSVQDSASDETYKAMDPWFAWPMDFEAGATHLVTVSFEQLVRSQKDFVGGQDYAGALCFDYVLVTGAAWDGPIGDAEISVQLPEDIDLDAFYAVSPPTSGLPGQTAAERQGQTVIWRSKDFEPFENFGIAFFPPETSAELRRARQAAASSNDAADQGRLADLLFGLSNGPVGQLYEFNPGNERLLSEGMLAVERGLALDPNSSAVWSAILRVESGQAYTLHYQKEGEPFGMLRAIVAAERVLQLDPANQEARTFLGYAQQYQWANSLDPQVDPMVREGASLALAGAAPGAPPPTGSGSVAAPDSNAPPLRWMAEVGIALAGALAMAGVLTGAGAIVRRARKRYGR